MMILPGPTTDMEVEKTHVRIYRTSGVITMGNILSKRNVHVHAPVENALMVCKNWVEIFK